MQKKITFFSHLLVWLVLFSMPYLLSYDLNQDIYRVIIHFSIPLLFYVIIFYFNYFVLIDRLLFAKKMFIFIIINVAMIAMFITLKENLEDVFFSDLIQSRQDAPRKRPPFKMFIYIQMLSYMAPLLFSIAIKSTKRWVKTEAERKEAANIKLRSELQHLHYQLQPHFFFNSLNNIYALVDVSPDQAKTTIHSLGKLMRYMLYETNHDEVPLWKEIEFMKKYIDLMKLRVSDKTTVNYRFPSVDLGVKIVPLIFISLIENAFKHGVSASNESTIDINMTFQNNTVALTIENDNLPKKMEDKSGSGIGLPNIKKRLELLYSDKHVFKTSVKNKRFVAYLEVETA